MTQVTKMTWMTQMTQVTWINNRPNFPVEVLTWSDNLQRSLNDQMTCVLRKVGHLLIWQITFGMTSQLLVTSLVIWRSGRHFTKWPKWPKWPNKLYLSLTDLKSGPCRAPSGIFQMCIFHCSWRAVTCGQRMNLLPIDCLLIDRLLSTLDWPASSRQYNYIYYYILTMYY